MSIKINKDRCTGCGKCRLVCPGSLIKKDEEGKSFIKFPKDCWGCTSCIKECNDKAISYYLGADIGGVGSIAYTVKEGNITNWIIEDNQGVISNIEIDKNNANAY
ncbi:4Fe-4S dicluster domain-containing protein [Clostridium paraputrificum]|uniref:4Fe-4S dicluster domain-containing protein n=1 Tax=Clostridium TaxID=1485 RepID=UPI003D33C4BB